MGAGQTVTMVGSDTLVLDAPAAFAGNGRRLCRQNDKIVVDSATAVTGVNYAAGANGIGTLTLSNGTTVGRHDPALAGDFTGDELPR